jgi:hypothetical protein
VCRIGVTVPAVASMPAIASRVDPLIALKSPAA